MAPKFTRRSFLKATGTTVASAAAASVGTGIVTPRRAQAKASWKVMSGPAPLPKPKGQRVVVVGGGWSGLTMAKYLKKEDPKLDVVLIEKDNMFMSCPLSSMWMVDLVDLEFLTYSYLDAAKNNDYTFLNATVIDVDRVGHRKVFTEQGYVKYDFLVLAPGIDYNYESIGVDDPEEQSILMTDYPAGFKAGSELLSIKNKLDGFEGGTFLLTVPTGNYRCLPGPYERACLMAGYMKENKIKGKVLLLDANPNITIKAEGFQAAFDDLYKGYLERVASVNITGVDVGKKIVKTEFDEYEFEDAAIYPRVRGALLLATLGIAGTGPQMEADIDPLKYNVKGDKRVYVTGDSRPMPYSKSGNTSNSEAHHVAKVIAARANGTEIPWISPHTVCFSTVNAEPEEAISVDAYYKYNPADGSFAFDRVQMDNSRSSANGVRTHEWAKGMYKDLFS